MPHWHRTATLGIAIVASMARLGWTQTPVRCCKEIQWTSNCHRSHKNPCSMTCGDSKKDGYIDGCVSGQAKYLCGSDCSCGDDCGVGSYVSREPVECNIIKSGRKWANTHNIRGTVRECKECPPGYYSSGTNKHISECDLVGWKFKDFEECKHECSFGMDPSEDGLANLRKRRDVYCAAQTLEDNDQPDQWWSNFAKFGVGCVDMHAKGTTGAWVDADGDTCKEYEGNDFCSTYGSQSILAVGGLDADTACCECGGGVSGLDNVVSSSSDFWSDTGEFRTDIDESICLSRPRPNNNDLEQSCSSLDPSQKCEQCDGTPMYLYQGKCWSKCPSETFGTRKDDASCTLVCEPITDKCLADEYSVAKPTPISDRVCRKCNSVCASCTGPYPWQCLDCTSGKSKIWGTAADCPGICFTKCGEGMFVDTSNSCSPCHSFNCKTCSSSKPNGCTICKEGTYLHEGKCVPVCPETFGIVHQSTGICTQCDKLCTSCSGLPSYCTSCRGKPEGW